MRFCKLIMVYQNNSNEHKIYKSHNNLVEILLQDKNGSNCTIFFYTLCIIKKKIAFWIQIIEPKTIKLIYAAPI